MNCGAFRNVTSFPLNIGFPPAFLPERWTWWPQLAWKASSTTLLASGNIRGSCCGCSPGAVQYLNLRSCQQVVKATKDEKLNSISRWLQEGPKALNLDQVLCLDTSWQRHTHTACSPGFSEGGTSEKVWSFMKGTWRVRRAFLLLKRCEKWLKSASGIITRMFPIGALLVFLKRMVSRPVAALYLQWLMANCRCCALLLHF